MERNLAPSRAKAQALIMAGQVVVDGVPVLKVGALVSSANKIALESGPKYVSRGGDKLEGALIDFIYSPKGLVCLDVGASTGGFTDCLLKHGAALVHAIDVGRAQLVDSMKKHPRVRSQEEKHILDVKPGELDPPPAMAVVDVSFISIKKVLLKLIELLPKDADVIGLVKPQFEVGAKHLRKGVVKSDEVRIGAVQDVVEFAKRNGFTYLSQTLSKLKGPKGNQEYFIHLKTHGNV